MCFRKTIVALEGEVLEIGCGGLQPSERTLYSLLFYNPAESSKAESGGPNGSVEQFWHGEPDELSWLRTIRRDCDERNCFVTPT